jgi:hypothetical protein
LDKPGLLQEVIFEASEVVEELGPVSFRVSSGVHDNFEGNRTVTVTNLVPGPLDVEVLQEEVWNDSDVIVTVTDSLGSCWQGVHAVGVLAAESF